MNDISQLVQTACTWEALSRKVGNVHPHADFTNTTLADFLLSAIAIGPAFRRAHSVSVGRTVLSAVEATQTFVGQNTNLGICLALAPLAAVPDGEPLRTGVQIVLNELTVSDAELVYRAIRLAAPGGLGDAPEQDVRDAPTVTLLKAMTLAADRDLIAQQYDNGYADLFDFGVPALVEAFEKFGQIEPAVIECQLKWLAEFPDSLIARKKGIPAAEDVRQRVVDVLKLGGLHTQGGRRAGVELDRYLRSDGNALNPGTTADIVTACLFVALREEMLNVSANFAWDVPDWL